MQPFLTTFDFCLTMILPGTFIFIYKTINKKKKKLKNHTNNFKNVKLFYSLKGVQTPEELNDVHMHFLLYYSHLIPKMKEKKRQKDREERAAARKQARRKRANVEDDGESVIGNEEEPDENEEPEIEEPEVDILKPAARGGPYAICRKAKLGKMKLIETFLRFNSKTLFY